MISKSERFHCSKCGRFVTEPKDVAAGQSIETHCTLGHLLLYHSPVVYYVNKEKNMGNDSNDGLSVLTPFKTLGKAFEMCLPYDVILLFPGEYTETIAV